ncbi:MAG: ATP-dependent helicase HrpB [Pelosinus sp.]|jgi:ATP-dependent helicase HrpB|nr:ATP-dependent helicase HrpB [Pelosinus sp.]
MKKLPIDDILPALRKIIGSTKNTVLMASPGAGKTTRLPLGLLAEPWLAGKKILILEPRRLAARAAARHMAALLGEQVGGTVGYRVRMDTCIGPKTSVEVITEGILTRMLQEDPGIENVGMVIFDEFHERSIHADLGLALCLESQAVLREDLKILVMSATLDTAPVAALLDDAPVIISEGVSFPVETYYLQRPLEGRIELAVAHKIQEAIEENQGDILVFLPGLREIHRVESQLLKIGIPSNIVIRKLYGSLSQAQQDLAILPEASGKRKIVLTTSIAETSITVEGVQVVIDSGLMRVPRFSPRTGMMHLETIKVARGVADQRRGRAGRLAAGTCYRLWTLQEEAAHLDRSTPEIMEADLTSLVLELAAWGIQNPEELRWIDSPPKAAVGQARQLLFQLGALSGDGRITSHGQQLVKTGLHPRLAHMIFQAISLGYGNLACEIAALLSHRDLFQGDQAMPDADLRSRIAALRQEPTAFHPIQVDIRHWKQLFSISAGDNDDIDACGLLLAFAYPDRIAQGRGDGRFLLRNGHGAAFKEAQYLAKDPYLVVAELGGDQGREKRIFLAASIHVKTLKNSFKEQIEIQDVIAWDHEAQAVRARRVEKLGALILENNPLMNCDPEKIISALLRGIVEEGLALLPWKKTACQFRQRLDFMHSVDSTWPNVSDEALLANLEEWLGPFIYGMSSWEHLQRLNLVTALGSMLTWEQGQKLDEWAPTHILVPSGQRIPIDYSNPTMPVLAVRLQEMFGLQETPRIGKGKITLILHLLSPAHRPIQVTKDIASFWENTYVQVKKDLMGRYPKHYWPDNPKQALPTHRIRPRS